jgi:hypothetical protein
MLHSSTPAKPSDSRQRIDDRVTFDSLALSLGFILN